MSRLNVSLAFGLIVVGLTGVLPAQACPIWGTSDNSGSEVPNASAPVVSQAVRPDDGRSTDHWQMGMSGLGAIATVLAVSSAYARFRQQAGNSQDSSLQPELEHPELALVSLPSEARGYSSGL